MNGADVLLLVETSPGNYTAVGSQRDAKIERASGTIDLSCNGDIHQLVEYGRRTSSISLDAVYVPDDTAYQMLVDAYEDGDMIAIRVEEEGTEVRQASAKIDKISESHPDQDTSTISIDLTVSGAWTELGS